MCPKVGAIGGILSKQAKKGKMFRR